MGSKMAGLYDWVLQKVIKEKKAFAFLDELPTEAWAALEKAGLGHSIPQMNEFTFNPTIDEMLLDMKKKDIEDVSIGILTDDFFEFLKVDAEELIAEMQQDRRKVWFDLGIKNVVIYPRQDVVDFEFLDGTKITVERKKVGNCSDFRSKLFFRSKFLLPFLKKDEWEAFLTHLMHSSSVIENDNVSEEDAIGQAVINYINTSKIVAQIEQTFGGSFVFLSDDGSILVPTEKIKKFMEKNGYKVNLTQLHHLIKPLLKGGTIVKKIGKQCKRFWVFDPIHFYGIDKEHVIDFSDTDESDGQKILQNNGHVEVPNG